MLGWMLSNLDKERPEGGGGGGRARIRLGNTGPRGRMYAVPATSRTTVVVKSKFIRAGKGSHVGMREHLRYVEERERGEGEKERDFFDRSDDGIERDEVYKGMMQNRGDRAAMHTLILSPGDNNINLREYTRDSMGALENRLGHKLTWYAVTHENTNHHHAHVVIAGKIPGHERSEWVAYPRRADRDMKWASEEKELGELLGGAFDERAALDPREERRLERQFGYGSEREEADPNLKDLIGDNVRFPEELKTERMLDRYEWRMGAKERAMSRGEVYLDRGDFKELRDAGNDFLTRERSLERSLEKAYEQEFGREMQPERTFNRDQDLDHAQWSQISREFDTDRFLKDPSHQRDDQSSPTREEAIPSEDRPDDDFAQGLQEPPSDPGERDDDPSPAKDEEEKARAEEREEHERSDDDFATGR